MKQATNKIITALLCFAIAFALFTCNGDAFAQSEEWSVVAEQNEMDGATGSYQATSQRVSSTERENVSAKLVVFQDCNWAKQRRTMIFLSERLGIWLALGESARIKIDDGEPTKVYVQRYGPNTRIGMLSLSFPSFLDDGVGDPWGLAPKLAEGKSALLEIPRRGGGHLYFRFSLDGANDAMDEAQTKTCA